MWKALLILVFLLCGCREYSQSEWDCGEIYRSYTNLRCLHRVGMLSKKMNERGESYDIVIGRMTFAPRGERHIWIEQGGRILDPTLSAGRDEYIEEERYHVDGSD